MLKTYRVLTQLAVPVAPLILAWRTRRGKEEPERRPERYGLPSVRRPPGFLAWFHAASVGEVNAALPVIETIAAEHPELRVLLTTGTVTSARLARSRLPQERAASICAARQSGLRAALPGAIGARTSPCWSNRRSGRTSCSRPRRTTFRCC